MKTVNQCCCGCTLRTGSIIIGIFYLIISGIALIMYSTYASATAAVYDDSVAAMFIVLAVIYGIQFVANVLLMVAIFGDKHLFFIPWLVTHIIVCILTSLAYLAAAIIFFLVPNGYGVGIGVAFIVLLVIGLGLQAYFIMVVYSLYREIKGNS